MGMLTIKSWGSFPTHDRTFGAMEHGHAHAVAQAIQFLSTEVLPEAIEREEEVPAIPLTVVRKQQQTIRELRAQEESLNRLESLADEAEQDE